MLIGGSELHGTFCGYSILLWDDNSEWQREGLELCVPAFGDALALFRSVGVLLLVVVMVVAVI
jgi:hypothetical protein